MQMHPVISDNVKAVGYDPDTSTLRVHFRKSRLVYDYYGAPAWIFDRMLQPHPWRVVGRQIMRLGYTKRGYAA